VSGGNFQNFNIDILKFWHFKHHSFQPNVKGQVCAATEQTESSFVYVRVATKGVT
jgi:hypothetical protein